MTGHDERRSPPQAAGRDAPEVAGADAGAEGEALLAACLAEMKRAEAALPEDHAAGAKRRILALALAEQTRQAPPRDARTGPGRGVAGRRRRAGLAPRLAGGLLAASLLIGLALGLADRPDPAVPDEAGALALGLIDDDAPLPDGALLAGGLAEAILFGDRG